MKVIGKVFLVGGSFLFSISLASNLFAQAAPARQGWETQWSKTLAEAKREGKVTVVVPSPRLYQEVFPSFQEALPDIKIHYEGLNTSREFLPRATQERAVGQFNWDVYVNPTESALKDLKPKGLTQPLPPALMLPEALDSSKWLGGFEAGYADKDRHIYTFSSYLMWGVYLNRDAVPKQELQKAEDLLNPKWKGKILLLNPITSGQPRYQLAGMMARMGKDFVRRLLTEQKPVIIENRRQQVDWLVRGRYPIALGLENTDLVAVQKEGEGKNVEPLQDPRVGIITPGYGSIALIDQSPHSNAARVFINLFLSRKGQEAWAKITTRNSRRLDVVKGDPAEFPDLKRLHEYANVPDETTLPLLDEVRRVFQEVIKP